MKSVTSTTGIEVDASDVAEWVGLHYARNVEAETAEKKQEWVDRFADAHGLVAESVQDVVDDVLERARKYGFQPDEDMVRGAVEESANLLNFALSEEQIVQACERVMQPQETVSERQPG